MDIQQDRKTENLLEFIAKSGFIIFLGSIVGKILRFIFSVILTRVLGAYSYGLYSIGQGIVDVSTNIGLLGDGRGLIWHVSNFLHRKDAPRLKGVILSYLFICFWISVTLSILIFTTARVISINIFHDPGLILVLRLFSVGLPFYILTLVIIPIGYAFKKVEYKVIMQEFLLPVMNIAAVGIIFILGYRLYGAVAGFIISGVFGLFLGVYFIKKIYPEIFTRSECIYEPMKLLGYSTPIVGIIFCYYLLSQLGIMFLGAYRSAYEVGIYSAATNIAMFMLAFTGILETGFTPVIAQLHHAERKDELIQIFNCVTFWGVSFAFLPCLGIIIFNKEAMALFGNDFTAGSAVSIVITVSLLAEIIPGQLRQLFQMSSHQKAEFINSFVMVVSNIVFNLQLIPRWGMMGAAVSFLLSVSLVSVMRVIEAKLFFNFNPFNLRYIKLLIYLVFVLLFACISSMDKNILYKIIALISIGIGFLVLVFLLKNKEDMAVLQSLKARIFRL